VAPQEESRCWIFAFSGLKVHLHQGISDHNGVLLEVEWYEKCRESQVERTVPVYHKTDVLSMQAFLREKFELWARNGSSVEGIWNSYKGTIFEDIKRYVPKNLSVRILTLNTIIWK
jgi:hypothetical protein